MISRSYFFDLINLLNKTNQVDEYTDCSRFTGEKIKINDTVVTIKGIDYKTVKCSYSDKDNKYYDDYVTYNSYFVCNENTYNKIYGIKDSVTKKLFQIKNGDIRDTIYIYKEETPVLSEGRMPSFGDEIILSENLIDYYFPGENASSVIGKSVSVYYYQGNYDICNHELKIVGVSDKTCTTDNYFADLCSYSRDSLACLYNRSVSLARKSLFVDKVRYLTNNGYENAMFNANDIEIGTSFALTIGSVLIVISLPLAGLLIAFQLVNAKQEILSNKRIIGIMKSMNYSVKSIKKIFVIDSLIQNIISFIISFVISPFSIMLLNYILINKGFTSCNVFSWKFYFVFIIAIVLFIVSYLSIVWDVKRLNKKSDVDLVYER